MRRTRAGGVLLLVCAGAAADPQWKALGPFGGSAAVVQTDPHSARTVVAGTSSGLLFRSRDGGDTWEGLPFPLQLRAALHTIAIHPRIRGLYLAGVSPERPDESGLWRSEDAGGTWQPVPAFANSKVRALAIFRGDTQIIAAGTDTGVFESTDAGITWRRISPEDNRELQPVVSVAFDPKDSRLIYAGTPHLPWKTVNGGETWRSIHTSMIDDSDVFSIVVDRNRPERVFAGACSGVYRSFNGGFTWSKMAGAKEAGYRTYVLAQDPQYEKVVFAGTTHGTIRSADGGTTWMRVTPYTTRSIAFDPGQLGRMYVATDEAGIVRSDDGGLTWEPANRGFSNRRLSRPSADDEGTVYTAAGEAGEGGFFALASGVEEWLPGDYRGERLLAITPSAHIRGTLYGATKQSALTSIDGGKTWTRQAAPWREPVTELLAPAWTGEAIVAAAGARLSVSRDGGATWETLEFPNPIRGLAALDDGWVAAITPAGVYLSNDGENWRPCAGVPGGTAHGIASNGRRLIAATTAGLRASANQGRSWERMAGPLEGNTTQAICGHPARPGALFAASYGTIFESRDGGRSWRKISPEGWPVDSVRQLLVAPGAPDRLLVVTQQQGVFALELR